MIDRPLDDLAWTARTDASDATLARKRRSHDLIPGGAHTYAKGDDQFPVTAPSFLVRGEGAHVWDSDGNRYLEYGSGLRSVILGHGHPRVAEAVAAAARAGTNFTRPSLLEVDLAERVLDLVGRHDHMVKFGKNGSDATSAAVRLARAATGRDLVAVCADHPFFSVDDWFITTTAMPAGIPGAVHDLTVTFPYGDVDALDALFDAHPGRVAAVVLEAAKYADPPAGYLADVQARCRRDGAVLVLDEMITGLRWPTGSAQRHYGIEPDLSTFGKAIGNGFSVSALVGRRDLMERGGLRTTDPRVFLLSLTHGAETTGLAAALATLEVHAEQDVPARLADRGGRLAAGIREVVAARGVDDHVALIGLPPNLVFAVLDADRRPSQAYRTLFLQELLARGIIAPSFVVSTALTDDDIDRTVEAVDAALVVHAKALEDGPDDYLVGRPTRPVFRDRV